MCSMSMKWTHCIKIHLTHLFSHDSSGFHAFPQALSLVDTSSPKIRSDGFQILGSCFQPLLICMGNLKREFKI